MSPSQYEQQYGRIPDDEVIVPSMEDGAEMDSTAMDDSMGGFGSHFMLNNGQDQDNEFSQQV